MAAHSGDDRAPGPAAVPAVSLASGSVRNPIACTVCHTVSKAKETAVMKARETTLCIHGSAKLSVPGGGGGSSNKSDPAAAGNGKAPVWYHKHWQPVNHTSYPIQVYESA
jgi:predicted CXXCH cytochrome family protein